MIVGLESGHLSHPRTGVANYTFHIVRSVLELEPALRFVGFRNFQWSALDLLTLQQIESAQTGQHETGRAAPSRRSWVSRHLRGLASRVISRSARLQSARTIYRNARQTTFAGSVGAQRLDLFHAFNFRPSSDPGVPVLPVVYDLSTFRYPEFHPAERVRWLATLGETIGRAPMVQTISEFSKREIVSVFGYPADRVFVAPPAAAPLFRPLGQDATGGDLACVHDAALAPALGLDYGNFFLAVGTLEPRKNIRTLVAAYARLSPAEQARFPLVVAGGKGWGDLNLPQQAEALRREGTLRFIDGSRNPQLRSLYEGARILLMPSLYEGFGMPVVEALACGTPVAHSADTSMDEISGGLGRRVPAMDVDGWTTTLREAMASRDHADEASRGARIERAGRFDWSGSARLVSAAYRQMVGP
jgi:glycosyltransferase involved in cell wall biosynthesis